MLSLPGRLAALPLVAPFMTAARGLCAKPGLPALIVICLALSATPWASAQTSLPPPEEREAWLVTYGPGEIYWQRFGHNAIWLREPGGLDHAFNFGFFDFEQKNFLLRFVQGRMNYFAAAVPAAQEFDFYAREGRSVRVQRLNLSAEGYEALREFLLRNVQAEHREYLYDYYRNNCSTRLRDALDLALEGGFSAKYQSHPADQNLRAHTRRSTESDRAYYLGLVAALGLPIDRPISRWEEMFLPAVLARSVSEYEVASDGRVAPLVTEERVLVPGSVALPPDAPGRTWPFYGLLGVLLLIAGVLLQRFGRSTAVTGVFFGYLLLVGTLGLLLGAAWMLTDHHDAFPNLNLLLLNPLALLALLPSLRRITGGVLLAGVFAALAAALWPNGQYMVDTLALLGPINGTLGAWLLRAPNSEAQLTKKA